MNINRFEGNWGQLKGAIRKTWSDISDYDLEQYKGKMEELIGFIQKTYGESKEEVEEKINKFISVIK